MSKRIYVGNLPFSPTSSTAELERISRQTKIPVKRLQEIANGKANPTSAELKALKVPGA